MEEKKFDPRNYNFDDNYMAKVELLGEELGEEWLNSVVHELNYKDPLLWPNVVSAMVANTIEPCSKNPKSVRVYAILTEQTEDAMYDYMVRDGR